MFLSRSHRADLTIHGMPRTDRSSVAIDSDIEALGTSGWNGASCSCIGSNDEVSHVQALPFRPRRRSEHWEAVDKLGGMKRLGPIAITTDG